MHRRRAGVLYAMGFPRGSLVFSGEILAHKCSRIKSSKASISFIYRTDKAKFNSSTDRQHGSSLLFTSHGRHPEQTLIKILKIIWGYLVERNIHLTAEYILSLNNQTEDWNSRNFQDSSKWNLCPTFFTQICSHLWKPLLDLSASRLCHQLPRYIAW